MNRETRRLIRMRACWLFLLLCSFIFLLSLRLYSLQISGRGHYLEIAEGQRVNPAVVDPQRGRVLDTNGQLLAVSIGADAVYAIPTRIHDPQHSAELLAQVLSPTVESLTAQLNSSRPSVWLERKLTPEQSQALRQLELPGIQIVQRPQRFYPNGSLAAHVLGFCGVDNQGLEGLEYHYDEVLGGIPGQIERERDARQQEIPGGIERLIPPEPGKDVVLSIDAVIQYIAERELAAAVTSSRSEAGLVVLMDPQTGGILANAVYPSFDPNDYQAYPESYRRNTVVTDRYEPGSTFKLVTAAAALETGMASESSMFTTRQSWSIGGGTVRSSYARVGGQHSLLQALETSDNITFAKLATEMGPTRFFHQISDFGFGSPLGIDFPGENSGFVPAPGSIRHGETLQWANIGFGQGLAVTPLQMLSAVAAVAADGRLLQPYYVAEIRTPEGQTIFQQEPKPIRQAVSEETAERIKAMLRATVVSGTGNRAESVGYFPAGKTGTAEVAEQGGYGDKRIASFVGFAPVDRPAVAALVMLYNPQRETRYGGVLAAPVFQSVVSQALEHLDIKRRIPTTEQSSMAAVPNLRSLSLEDADRALTQADLRPNFHGQGTVVLDQLPSPGNRVPLQTIVNVFLDDNDQAPMIEVPPVLGLSSRDAVEPIQDAQLRVEVVGSGTVTHQNPAPGSHAPTGSVIEVICSP